MVMETPSPQCVGREFVRQYYTLLHEAPLHLHRFYSNNSSFVHGGVEKPGEEQAPVMGQAEIHKKIVSLNFRDCHAKIRQVDSQATVGSGVVVQVTGELSNNGHPMRRFMQTFVLAPQSPKKYYVHNDIFRYQDEVFHEDDSETETMEEDSETEMSDQPPVVMQSDPSPAVTENFFEPSPIVPQQPPQLSNGSIHVDERPETPPHVTVDPESPKAEEPAPPPQEIEAPKEKEPDPEPVESKPFSWADIATKNTAQGVAPPVPGGPAPAPKTVPPVVKPVEVKVESQGPSPPQAQRAAPANRVNRDRPPIRDRPSMDRTSMSRNDDDDGMRPMSMRRYPDTQQLFVGNLPQNTTEQELKDFFSKYGKIEELRINTKAGGGKLPNFGFVVFDGPTPVHDILALRPILYNNHRLNVEEKKHRDSRAGSGNRRDMRGERGSSTGRGGPGMDRNRPGRGGVMGGRDRMGPDRDRGGRGGFGGGPRR